MNPLEIRRVDHVVLRVRDLDRSLDFYVNVLGCREERRVDALGLVQLRAGESLIDLVPVEGALGRVGGAPPGKDARNVDHIALRVARLDLPALRAHLERHGVELPAADRRYGAEGFGLSVYLRDPDDNTVELCGPLEEAP